MERLRMSESRAFRPPLARHWTVCKLHQIESILNKRIELVDGHEFAGIKLASHSAIENWQRLGSDIFAEHEVFIKTEPKRLIVVGRWTMLKFRVPAIE